MACGIPSGSALINGSVRYPGDGARSIRGRCRLPQLGDVLELAGPAVFEATDGHRTSEHIGHAPA